MQALRGVSIAVRQLHRGDGAVGVGQEHAAADCRGLDRPTGGRAWIGPVDLSKLSQTRLTELRRDRVGFVFQAFNLVPSLTVEQNVTCRCGWPVGGPTAAWSPRCSGGSG